MSSRSRQSAGALLCALASTGVLILWLSTPAQGREGSAPELSDNRECRECHQEEWKEWEKSRHFVAGANQVFDFEYDSHPGDWCLGCHSPRLVAAGAQKLPRKAARRQGVDCISCHVVEGKLVSRQRASSSPHKTLVDRDFGGTAMCENCHQFNFPVLDKRGDLVRYTDQPMQDTVAEFRRSSAAKNGAECIDCHMNKGTHLFPGSYFPEQVKKALKVDLCRRGSELVTTIKNRLAAHNLPSGGVNRALVFQIWEKTNPTGVRTHRLERLFRGPIGRRVKKKDTTLRPGQSFEWVVEESYLSLKGVDEIVVKSEFYFGTDPNRYNPLGRVVIDTSTHSWDAIPACSEP